MHIDRRALVLAGCSLLGCGSPSSDQPTGSASSSPPSSGEAKTQVAKLFDASASYFRAEHPASDPLVAIHQCPNDGQLSGSAGLTPPLSVRCAAGDDGECVPGGSGPSGYPAAVWTDNPVWKALEFDRTAPHRFHYDYRWKNSPEGYGLCQFTVQAFADLDDDGIYSTFERQGVGDMNGINAAIGLYVDQELE